MDDARSGDLGSAFSGERFTVLFSEHPLPMWIYDLETLAFLDVNDAAVARYGYSRDAFLAMRLTDIRLDEGDVRLAPPASGATSCGAVAWSTSRSRLARSSSAVTRRR